ncbi:GIP [Symbiodinium pilosum]|uniref:GIP protein n=1 Tax=Symbiodinium pilosum TaxID=2952 RepID=A0A812PK95_SYMPI|nr:GIP [Symbiodinium pilosum]
MDDVRHDPIEVTLCRNVKKDLAKSIDAMTGGQDDECFWETCEQEHVNLYVDVYMENGEPRLSPPRPPRLPSPDQLRDESFELRACGKRARWTQEQGYLVMLCLDPRRVPIHSVGPGHRTLRWTAVREDDEWRWCEKECQGPVDKDVFEANSAMIYYAWDKAESMTLAEGHELSAAGCRNDIIQYVQLYFRCAGCDLEQRPPTRLPAATPRCYDFNVVIGIDVLFIHGLDNKTEHPVLNVTCLGTLYSTFGLIDPLRRSAKLTLKAFERLWVRTFGPPDFLLYDMGTEFTGGDFQSGIERMCIQPIVCDQDAPWENGVCERRGDLFKKIYYKSRELAQPRDLDEVELLVFESAWALQTSVNRSGFTPAQRVLGRQPRVALDLASDDKHYELSVTQDKAWTRASELRQAARKALLELGAKERVQRASRAKPRRQLENQVFTEGQPVVVWRQGRRGALSKVGPCFVVLQRGSTVWVTRRGELWKCNVAQVFAMGPLEVQGLEAIPRDLLMAKERRMSTVVILKDPPLMDRKLHHQHLFPRKTTEQFLENHHFFLEEPPSDVEGTPQMSYLNHRKTEQFRENHRFFLGAMIYMNHQRPGVNRQQPEPGRGRREFHFSHVGHEWINPNHHQYFQQDMNHQHHPRRQWPQAVDIKKWTRFDNNADRFRVSSSKGPMWSDVTRRVTLDLDTGRVVADEEFTGDERPRMLSRALPQGVKNIETTLFYRPRPGHPDPGVPVESQAGRQENMDEDRRLFDRGLKRAHDGTGQHGNPQPKSKVGGIWVADVVTPWGDKRKFPVIANARDLQAFSKLVKTDVFYTYSELHSGWICLTKKSGKEIQERNLTSQERRMFDEAKLTEIENLEGSSAISFVTDSEEIRKIKESFSHRIMPPRFILTKKQQELGQTWKAKARWILLGHRDIVIRMPKSLRDMLQHRRPRRCTWPFKFSAASAI